MSDFPGLGWNVPEAEFGKFLRWVRDKHGYTDRYAGFEIEEAMRAFLDDDAGADVEARLNELLADTEHDSDGSAKEKIRSEATTQPGYRVNPELKDRFRAAVKRMRDSRHRIDGRLTYGRALALALREHRDGGRWRRVGEKVDRLADVVAAADGFDDTQDELTTQEQRTRAIAAELEFPFTREDFGAALEAADAAVSDTSYCRDQYLERVFNHLDAALNPVVDREEFIPREEAERLHEDPTEADLLPADLLSTEARVDGLCQELHGGKCLGKNRYRLRLSEIRNLSLFDGRGSLEAARELASRAAQRDGVKYHDGSGNGPECLLLDTDVYQPTVDVAVNDTDEPASTPALADGGWPIEAAAGFIQNEHPGERAPSLLRAVLSRETDRDVPPDEIPDDAVERLERRLVADELDRHTDAVADGTPTPADD